MSTVVVLYVTAPDRDTADRIAAALVEARLCACVNILGEVASLFPWRGAIERATEIAFLVKTTMTTAVKARNEILRLHPYETPAILAFPVAADGSNPAYLTWVEAETRA